MTQGQSQADELPAFGGGAIRRCPHLLDQPVLPQHAKLAAHGIGAAACLGRVFRLLAIQRRLQAAMGQAVIRCRPSITAANNPHPRGPPPQSPHRFGLGPTASATASSTAAVCTAWPTGAKAAR